MHSFNCTSILFEHLCYFVLFANSQSHEQAQKLLDNMLEKHLVIVQDACNVPDDDSVVNESGVRLFKNSTPGIVFDHVGEYIFPSFSSLAAIREMFLQSALFNLFLSLSLLLLH